MGVEPGAEPSESIPHPPPAGGVFLPSQDAAADLQDAMGRINLFFENDDMLHQLKGGLPSRQPSTDATPARGTGNSGLQEHECNAAAQELSEGSVAGTQAPTSTGPLAVSNRALQPHQAPRQAAMLRRPSAWRAENAAPASGVQEKAQNQSPEKAAPTSEAAPTPAAFKLKLGMPRLAPGSDAKKPTEADLRYLHVPDGSRTDFQQYAKELTSKLKVECADSNPYVKALSAHREELHKSCLDLEQESVDSLASKLATSGSSLAMLKVSGVPPTRSQGDSGASLLGCNPRGCTAERRKFEFLPSIDDSDGGSTAVTSARSDDFKDQDLNKRPIFSFKVSKGHLEFSRSDRLDLLDSLADVDTSKV